MSYEAKEKMLKFIDVGASWAQLLALIAVIGFSISTFAVTPTKVVRNGVTYITDMPSGQDQNQQNTIQLHEDAIKIDDLRQQIADLRVNMDAVQAQHMSIEHRLTALETISDKNTALLISAVGGVLLMLIQSLVRWIRPKDKSGRG